MTQTLHLDSTKKIFLGLTVAFFLIVAPEANAQFIKLLDFIGTNGASPSGSFVSDGTFLYGMTSLGGTNNKGVIFKIKTDGSGYVKLLDFAGATNGSNPDGSLFYDGTFLYGMTENGGTNNGGVIFKIKPDGTGDTVLFNFSGLIGLNPHGSLISDGNFLFGMTANGGTNNNGVIFKINLDGTGYSVLNNFNQVLGANPHGDLLLDGDSLYGLTYTGGASLYGVIFKIATDGTGYSKLYDFASVTDAHNPLGSLITDSIFLYGTTIAGGQNNSGAIFRIKRDGTGYSIIFNMGYSDGAYPYGSLISDGTYLYGTTMSGGINNGAGTIFKIKTDGNVFSKMYDFNSNTDGGSPIGSLISDGNFLYGLASYGDGLNILGTAFKLGLLTDINEDKIENHFTISPNPFYTQTVLRTDNLLKNATFTVYNCFGQSVKKIKNITGQTITLFRDNLPSGLYFYRLTEGNKILSVDKLVIIGN